jgi:hypothetical protein
MNTETLDCGHAPSTAHTYNGQPAWQFVRDGDRRICHACADARVLECGHTPSPHSHVTTGYGTDAAGNRHCYACCHAQDVKNATETGRMTCYLTDYTGGKLDTGRDRARISSWPGLELGKVTGIVRHPRGGGMGAQRTDVWFIGPDGQKWHGVNRGDNDILRCTRLKVRVPSDTHKKGTP